MKNEAIKAVIKYEIDQGGDAYEMLTDGYDGNIDAYIAEYESDFSAEVMSDGSIIVTHYSGGRPWIVTDGEVVRGW